MARILTPTEQIERWADDCLRRNQTFGSGHWLPICPVGWVLPYEPFTIALCRQVGEIIESKGYCVETDARSGCGTYERDQSLALFKPFEGDPIQPSPLYLQAANLLRICLEIATADDWIHPVKLDVIRNAIENYVGLSRTERKRLIVLEQLLTQRLCTSSYYTISKIAKSIPPDQRLVTAKLLVDVAVADNVMTKAQRSVLERICKNLAVAQNTLEELINLACPSVRYDGSKKAHWSLRKWRIHRAGILIDDFTLVEKRWNFTDWKGLNARWRTLHEQLEHSEHL